jgi:hypothetical protein
VCRAYWTAPSESLSGAPSQSEPASITAHT